MFLDIGVKGEKMIVLRVVLAMSTWTLHKDGQKKGNEWEAGSRAMGLLGLQGGSPVSGSNG